MVHAKNYETVSTFVKVMQKKTVASFSGHDVYLKQCAFWWFRLRKMMFGVKTPHKRKFWGGNRSFKPNLQNFQSICP